MRIPPTRIELAGGLACAPKDVPASVWQWHVMKHVFGLAALHGESRGDRQWNAEGWDALEPPLITGEARSAWVTKIRALDVQGARCSADRLTLEAHRGEPPTDSEPCMRCPDRLARECARVTDDVARRYATMLDAALGVKMARASRPDATRKIMGAARSPEALVGAAVLSFGLLASGKAGARVVRSDGVRSELYRWGKRLEWRTTYRVPSRGRSDVANALLDVLPPIPGDAASAFVLVPRPWWEGT